MIHLQKLQWRLVNGALVVVAVQISDCLTTVDWRLSRLVNWVNLVNCLTGD